MGVNPITNGRQVTSAIAPVPPFITVTLGGPGGATDSVTSFIYREYRDRSNVGYGTMLAMIYLVLIIVFVTLLLKLARRFVRSVT